MITQTEERTLEKRIELLNNPLVQDLIKINCEKAVDQSRSQLLNELKEKMKNLSGVYSITEENGKSGSTLFKYSDLEDLLTSMEKEL